MDCVEEAKAAAKKDSCQTLQKIATARVQSADEPLFKALMRCGLTVAFPIKELKLDDDLQYPCFPPREQLETLVEKGYFHKVLGVPVAFADNVLPEFWRKYQCLYPSHDVFKQQQDYSRLIPYYLHGDGGRTYKKDAIMIMSMFSAFGAGTAQNPVELQPVPPQGPKRLRSDTVGFQPGVNLRGNTFTSRFLFTAMKVEYYKKKNHRFKTLLDEWGQLLGALYTDGFRANGEIWKVVILGLTGDAPFLREAGYHNRSFSNVRKSSTSKAALPGLCWLCAAGKTNGPPFEDVRITAAWTRTCGINNSLPWDEPSPLLAYLPINDPDLAAFYRPDIFHVYHAGLGKDFTASSLIYMAKTIFKQRKLKSSIDDINAELKSYLKEKKEKLNFGSFSLDLLGYVSARSFPKGHWSKNMDTATVSKFVEHVAMKHASAFSDYAILPLIAEACSAIGHFMHIIFSSGFFLDESQGWQMVSAGHAFLSLYIQMSKRSFDLGLCLFALKPVVHLMSHIVHRALQQYKIDPSSVINPVAESTFMAEDLVGRISRLSRRVSAKKHGHKIFYRYMVATQFHLCHPNGMLDV